jgi:hypothetical protein
VMREGWFRAQNHRKDDESARRFWQSICMQNAALVASVK